MQREKYEIQRRRTQFPGDFNVALVSAGVFGVEAQKKPRWRCYSLTACGGVRKAGLFELGIDGKKMAFCRSEELAAAILAASTDCVDGICTTPAEMVQLPNPLELRSVAQALAIHAQRTQANACLERLDQLKSELLDEPRRAVGVGDTMDGIESETGS
ncbi:hypothetical protein D3C72_1342220 [compost metagenome]